VTDSLVLYAIFGVLLLLLLWRVATQWKIKGAEAADQRAAIMIIGVVIAALVAWYLTGLR
jgi:hypothetical protein